MQHAKSGCVVGIGPHQLAEPRLSGRVQVLAVPQRIVGIERDHVYPLVDGRRGFLQMVARSRLVLPKPVGQAFPFTPTRKRGLDLGRPDGLPAVELFGYDG